LTSKFANMKYSEVERKLKKKGCYCVDDSGKHPVWFSPITGKQFTLGHHKSQEVKKGTLHSIERDSGVSL
jgi:mRNA interferase HicA